MPAHLRPRLRRQARPPPVARPRPGPSPVRRPGSASAPPRRRVTGRRSACPARSRRACRGQGEPGRPRSRGGHRVRPARAAHRVRTARRADDRVRAHPACAAPRRPAGRPAAASQQAHLRSLRPPAPWPLAAPPPPAPPAEPWPPAAGPPSAAPPAARPTARSPPPAAEPAADQHSDGDTSWRNPSIGRPLAVALALLAVVVAIVVILFVVLHRVGATPAGLVAPQSLVEAWWTSLGPLF